MEMGELTIKVGMREGLERVKKQLAILTEAVDKCLEMEDSSVDKHADICNNEQVTEHMFAKSK
jgi:hypothetical protein